MCKAVYDKLPTADQQMIRKAAKESVAFQRKKWDEQEAKSLAVVKAGGAQIVRGRQGFVPERDGAGLREVHHHARPAAPGQGGPGHQVNGPRQSAGATPANGRGAAGSSRCYTQLCALLSKVSLMLAVALLIAHRRLRAVAGDRPLRPQRHAHLGRGAGAAAGAVRDRRWAWPWACATPATSAWNRSPRCCPSPGSCKLGHRGAPAGRRSSASSWPRAAGSGPPASGTRKSPCSACPRGLDYLPLVVAGVLIVLFSRRTHHRPAARAKRLRPHGTDCTGR